MKVEKLIEELQKMPPDSEVCLFDWRKNIHYANDEPIGVGIQADFKVSYEDESVTTPFVALNYENDDYSDSGAKVD